MTEAPAFLTILDHWRVIAVTTAFLAFYAGFSLVIGRIILRRDLLEGLALGLLVMTGGTGVALYVSRALGLPLMGFGGLAFLFMAATTATLRWAVFDSISPKRPVNDLLWPAFLLLAGLIVALRFLTPDPQAGYAVYQAWHPLYLEASLAHGFFPRPEDTVMGVGFLTSGQMAYPLDMSGPAALASWIVGGETHPAYFAATILPAIASVGLLLNALRGSNAGLVTFTLLMLFALHTHTPIRLVLLDNWGDIALYFAGTATIYYLAVGETARIARLGAAFASTFMVFSRPYGVLYSAIILIVLFLLDMRDPATRRNFGRWVACGVMLTVFSGRELWLVLNHGIYYGRPTFTNTLQPSFWTSVRGTVMDWGLWPSAAHSSIRFPHALPVIAALGLAFAIRRPRVETFALFAPLLILSGPLVTEFVTGYRKTDFSKLYIVTILLFPWYPAYVISTLRPGILRFPHWLRWSGVAAAIIFILAAAFPLRPSIIAKADWAISTYRDNNEDLLMARQIHAELGADSGEFVKRRILYLHLEPGAGLRYFLGGDLFTDADFWGEEVQTLVAEGKSLGDILAALDYPAVYKSFPSWRLNALSVQYSNWERVADEIDALDQSPLVLRVLRARNAALYITHTGSERDD